MKWETMIRGDSLCRQKVTLNPDFLPLPLRVSAPHLASLCVSVLFECASVEVGVNIVHLS